MKLHSKYLNFKMASPNSVVQYQQSTAANVKTSHVVLLCSLVVVLSFSSRHKEEEPSVQTWILSVNLTAGLVWCLVWHHLTQNWL